MTVCPVAIDPIIAKTQSKPVNNAKPLVKSSKRPMTVVPKVVFILLRKSVYESRIFIRNNLRVSSE